MLSFRHPGLVMTMAKKLLALPSSESRAFSLSVLPRRSFACGATGDDGIMTTISGDQTKTDPLPTSLKRELLPRHVAIILDGNSRWARRRDLPVPSGHEAGLQALQDLTDLSNKWGIRVLTVFAFSSENWLRPKEEVDFLMDLFIRHLESQLHIFSGQRLRISTIGDQSKLPEQVRRAIAEAEHSTKDNTGLHLVYAFCYSGKSDITHACKCIARSVKDGAIGLEDIDERLIEDQLLTSRLEFPHPDLLIRTSGELRLSNFLLWQSAYAELFFSPALWPDFGEAEFVEALSSYQQRKRRFGSRP